MPQRKCLLPIGALLLFMVTVRAQTGWPEQRSPLRTDEPRLLVNAGVKAVKCLFKDKQGMLWIGTGNGLFRFDGRHVHYLSHSSSDSTTIPGNQINTIGQDTKGNLWVGTHDGV